MQKLKHKEVKVALGFKPNLVPGATLLATVIHCLLNSCEMYKVWPLQSNITSSYRLLLDRRRIGDCGSIVEWDLTKPWESGRYEQLARRGQWG